jgi:hypothetical protein
MTKTPSLFLPLDSFVLKSQTCVPGQIPAPANSHIWTNFGRTCTNVIYLIINIMTVCASKLIVLKRFLKDNSCTWTTKKSIVIIRQIQHDNKNCALVLTRTVGVINLSQFLLVT